MDSLFRQCNFSSHISRQRVVDVQRAAQRDVIEGVGNDGGARSSCTMKHAKAHDPSSDVAFTGKRHAQSSKRRMTKSTKMTAMIARLRERRREAPKRTLAFFQALKLDAIVPALEEAQATCDGRDEVYRIFHQSWKMYYLGGAAVELAALMLVPLGAKCETKPKAVATAMRRWHLDGLFVDIFERTTSTVWSEKRNARRLWREDATQLTSGFMIVREVVLASLEAMDRMRRHEGFLFEEGPLDPTDALFLEVWTGVGDGLRYVRPAHLEERCRAVLASR